MQSVTGKVQGGREKKRGETKEREGRTPNSNPAHILSPAHSLVSTNGESLALADSLRIYRDK